MKFAIKINSNQFAEIQAKEDNTISLTYGNLPTIYYPVEIENEVCYLRGDVLELAMQANTGREGLGIFRNFSLLSIEGDEYVLDWSTFKLSDLSPVALILVKEIQERKYPESLIPELWKGHPQIYTKHFALKIHPFNYGIIRFDEFAPNLTPLQRVCLDNLDYAIKKYISQETSTCHYIGHHISGLVCTKEEETFENTIENIEPILLRPLQEILKQVEVPQLMDRYLNATSYIKKKTELVKLAMSTAVAQ